MLKKLFCENCLAEFLENFIILTFVLQFAACRHGDVTILDHLNKFH